MTLINNVPLGVPPGTQLNNLSFAKEEETMFKKVSKIDPPPKKKRRQKSSIIEIDESNVDSDFNE